MGFVAVYNLSRMPTSVRSHAKINLGLAIGPIRLDGYHALATIYQTLAIHDLVQVVAERLAPAQENRIEIACSDTRVPCDSRNTCFQIIEHALNRLRISAQVTIHIEKKLPVRGGLGAGSANAAAGLLGLERELDLELSGDDRLAIAAETGSDVPLFLIGGTVLGLGRGEEVYPLPDLPSMPCILATPDIGVSTPDAFREWDRLYAGRLENARDPAENLKPKTEEEKLTAAPGSDRLKQLGRIWASALAVPRDFHANATGVFPAELKKDRAGNLLLELVRAGIENDFEAVVFCQYPSLRGIFETLKNDSQTENSAIYAALSGSGSALFGLYRTLEEAGKAIKRLNAQGISACDTTTVGREEYWRKMFSAR